MNAQPQYRRRTGICLNMIVKNETPVLDRLFRSLRSVIDYYVIVDTGSTDGTPEFITQWMGNAGIPGEVHHRPWVNYGINRDQALQLAVAAGKADWVLFIDADEELGCSDPTFVQRLVPGTTYDLEKHHGRTRYALPALIDVSRNQWQWQAPVHEFVQHRGGPNVRQRLTDAWIIYHAGEGVRSRGKTAEEKFLGDAALLEAELATNPKDLRSRFYLAQSYRDAGHLDKARHHYLLRAASAEGWEEERFFAQFEAGRLGCVLSLARESVIEDLLTAVDLRPVRAEPLHELARYCREAKQWGRAVAFATAGAALPIPADRLFVVRDVYEWRTLDELAVSAYWAGLHTVSRNAAQEILARHERLGLDIADADLARIRENLRFAEERLS